ncbi:MAG: methylcrotonoyl-CoA carboxylase, partial [Rhodospirillaceae bacterium]|nr:methylcrotonoyl-CoA carboxylase [Rhodospirillaceae bacterium]
MAAIRSTLNSRTEQFRANEAYNRALVADLRETVGRIKQGGSDRAREKHLSRGKLLPR